MIATIITRSANSYLPLGTVDASVIALAETTTNHKGCHSR